MCAPKHSILGTKISVTIPALLQFEGAILSIIFIYFWSVVWQVQCDGFLSPPPKGLCFHIYSLKARPLLRAHHCLVWVRSATYAAAVKFPKWITVFISTLGNGLQQLFSSADEYSNITHWTQPVPTPAYLFSLTVGNLTSRDISSRIRIRPEQEVISAAHFEFAETEDFLTAAEQISNFLYQWGRYDVLCLPPSFRYGTCTLNPY